MDKIIELKLRSRHSVLKLRIETLKYKESEQEAKIIEAKVQSLMSKIKYFKFKDKHGYNTFSKYGQEAY